MSRSKVHLAVLFADISGSTRLYENLGNSSAQHLTSRCLELLAQIAQSFQGSVVKTIGDEVMCAFPDADSAASAAVKMQEDLALHCLAGEMPLQIRVGLHWGEVIRENGDLFGDAVNVAAHVTKQAKALQIFTTEQTAQKLSPEWREKTRHIDSLRLKGMDKTVDLQELLWGQEQDFTIMGAPAQTLPARPTHLLLRYGEQVVELHEKQPVLTIGRDAGNTLVVADVEVSRLHARIEHRHGRFVLIEQSTNGTQVTMADGKTRFLHRDQMPLEGRGMITLGKSPSGAVPKTIQYSCGSEGITAEPTGA